MSVYKSALGIRGDMLYCPLPLYIDPYWTCEPDCEHCYARRLNRTWGDDFRVADVDEVIRRLTSERGDSPLSRAIQQRKTIRMGNRSDPFQACEEEHRASTQILEFLMEEKWETVVQTKFPQRAWTLPEIWSEHVIIAAEVTVGMEEDWELFEHRMTENPRERVKTISGIQDAGFRASAVGEPFIPGYHTVEQFEETVKFLKAHGIRRYNTYNLHFNDLVAKNLCDLGLDIERIWFMNQDRQWRKILRQLLEIANEHDIILGCPDFVNSGWSDQQEPNTCCGMDVRNPCTFNAHHFKLAIQEGRDPLDEWDGVGEYEEGVEIVKGTTNEMYTMKDVVDE